jgi:cell shape-determining protein MreD
MVVMVAMYKDEITSLWFAISVGIVAGTLRFELMPWEILILAGMAILISYISTRVDLGAITSRLIILGGFILIHISVITLLSSNESFVYMIYRYILPSTIYTLVPGWLFFLIIDGRITREKIRAQF